MVSRDRTSALRALLAYELPVEPVLAELAQYGWDAAQPFVTLTLVDVVRILDRYLGGALSSEQVTDWADLVECRDDIAYPETDHEVLSAAIFRLANPSLEGDVTIEVAEELKRELVSREHHS